MKQAEMSHHTKSALAAALRVRLRREEFKKISIRDLTDDCKVNRQTFYYHFKDIYDLLQWAVEEDITDFIKQQNLPPRWYEALQIVFEYLDENKDMAVNAYNSVGHEKFFCLLNDKLFDYIHSVVRRYCEPLHISEKSIDFIASYYMITLTGIIESYLTGHLAYTPPEICDLLQRLLNAQIEGAKKIF